MKHMNTSRTIGLATCAFCIMALMVAAVSGAGTPGPAAGQGVKNTPAPAANGIQAYTMSQTISDQAQMMTISFDALAFITGDACSDTFLPPGKVADYAGFQYLRDNDKTEMGHNTDFVTRTADNVLITLSEEQLAQFVALSKEESTLSDQYGLMRFPLTTAFRNAFSGTTPSGSSGLDKAAVMAYSGKLYDVDASISLDRAKTYASVINSLNPTQRAYLDKMKSVGLLSYPVVDASEVLKNSGQSNSVAMRTYASEMFAWYAGSVDADVYFCPERQATYFGSFYMKDAPAMGNAGYSISTTLTGDSGETFLSYLTDAQREKITSLVDLQRADLNEIVTTRKAIATELRRPLTGGTIDENLVRTLSARYGALDGEISYYYATHFADVGKTLTSDQKAKMVALRNLAGYTCNGAYLYSQPISVPQNIPSNFLFGVGTYDATAMTAWLQGEQQTVASSAQGTGKTGQGPETGTRKNVQGGPTSLGNATQPKQGSGQGQNTQAQKPGNAGNTTQPKQGTGQGQNMQGQGTGNAGNTNQTGQEHRMPIDAIIAQLGQKGYDVTGATTAVQSGDREAQKAWLDTFKKNNPGIAEAIESSGMTNNQGQKTGTGTSNTNGQPRGQGQTEQKSVLDGLNNWLSSLGKTVFGFLSSDVVITSEKP